MTGPIHFMEFLTPEGVVIIRLDAIQTILESTTSGKGDGGPKAVFHFIIGNNAKVQVIGETRESLRQRMNGAGTNMVVIALPDPPAEVVMAAPEPVGNAVLPPVAALEDA